MRWATRIDGPVAVVGDVHGHADKLQVVLDQLRSTDGYEDRWIVFIGDFVDRGPNPRAVFETVLNLLDEHPRTSAVAGNHEFALCGALGLIPTPDHSEWDIDWVEFYDSETTFASYGCAPGDLKQLAQSMPARHKQAVAALPWCVEHADYLFVHAGLSSSAPLDLQLRILRERDFSLGRPQWLCEKFPVDAAVPHECVQTVVSGHVHVPQVHFGRKRILLDTCSDEGALSCVLLPERTVFTSDGDVIPAQARSWWTRRRKAA